MQATAEIPMPEAPVAEALPETVPPLEPGSVEVSPKVRAPPRRAARAVESLTPFVGWRPEERSSLPTELFEGPREPSLLVDLLREPSSVVERLLDPARASPLVLGSLTAIAVGTAAFAAVIAKAFGGSELAKAACLAGLTVLGATAAALGPVWVAGVLVAARVPLSRLVPAILGAAATGALLLGALAPATYFLWRLDSEWAGPLSAVAAFVVAGTSAGARLRRTLILVAERVTCDALGDPDARLSAADAFRVGIVARVALMMLGFTYGLALWVFERVS